MKLVDFIKYYSNPNIKLPTPKCKLHKGTIFYKLDDAIFESKNWYYSPIITLEKNGYYRFYGHGKKINYTNYLLI